MTNQQILVPAHFNPRWYQLSVLKALDAGAKKLLLVWPRRSGKDKVCVCYIAKQAATDPGNYFYVFPTHAEVRKALWENVDKDGFKLLDHIPKEVLDGDPLNQEMLLRFKNGSTLRFVGGDKNPHLLRGSACKGAVFSEFAFSDPECYKALVPSLNQADGFRIINSTPLGTNHFYDLLVQARKGSSWVVSEYQTLHPDKDNYIGIRTPAQLLEELEEDGLDEEDMEREYGCNFFSAVKGAFYGDNIDKARAEGRISTFEYNDDYPVSTFWDLGVSDSTVIWFAQKIGDRTIFIDYEEHNGLDIQEYVKLLSNKPYKYDFHVLPHDAGIRSLQSLRTTRSFFDQYKRTYKVLGESILVPKTNSVQLDIQKVRRAFRNYYFSESGCEVGLRRIEKYRRRFDRINRKFFDDPVHDEASHAADAFRMVELSELYRGDSAFDIPKVKIISNYDWNH